MITDSQSDNKKVKSSEEKFPKQKQPLISVVVPIYNSERYLRRCIDSILGQSFQDFELILVNDGSSDSSPQICDSYRASKTTAQNTPAVKVIHKPNGGVSSARNKGIESATGKYTLFIDSDDSVAPHYLKAFVKALEEVESSYKSATGKGNCLIVQNLVEDFQKIDSATLYPKRFFTKEELELTFTEYPLAAQHYSVCKLFHTQTLQERKIYFNQQVHFSEDLIFVFNYLTTVSSIFYIEESHYLRDATPPNSLSKKWHPFPEQFNSYKLILEATTQMVEALQLSQKAQTTLYRLFSNLSKFFKAIYHPQGGYNRVERIQFLNKLYSNYIEHFKRYPHFKESNQLKEFAAWLFIHKWLCILDLYQYLLYRIRYNKYTTTRT